MDEDPSDSFLKSMFDFISESDRKIDINLFSKLFDGRLVDEEDVKVRPRRSFSLVSFVRLTRLRTHAGRESFDAFRWR